MNDERDHKRTCWERKEYSDIEFRRRHDIVLLALFILNTSANILYASNRYTN